MNWSSFLYIGILLTCLSKFKRLATKEDHLIFIPSSVFSKEISERAKDYHVLTPKF